MLKSTFGTEIGPMVPHLHAHEGASLSLLPGELYKGASWRETIFPTLTTELDGPPVLWDPLLLLSCNYDRRWAGYSKILPPLSLFEIYPGLFWDPLDHDNERLYEIHFSLNRHLLDSYKASKKWSMRTSIPPKLFLRSRSVKVLYTNISVLVCTN